jgi:hypothetical protein
MSQPTVIKTVRFNTAADVRKYLLQMGAQYRKHDEQGRPLYKAPSSLVFRPKDNLTLDVLTNCAC